MMETAPRFEEEEGNFAVCFLVGGQFDARVVDE